MSIDDDENISEYQYTCILHTALMLWIMITVSKHGHKCFKSSSFKQYYSQQH